MPFFCAAFIFFPTLILILLKETYYNMKNSNENCSFSFCAFNFSTFHSSSTVALNQTSSQHLNAV